VILNVDDPLLGVDVGDLITKVPIRHELLSYWLALVVLGLVLAVLLYVLIGGIRRASTRVAIHPDARRHVGGLLAILAASIGLWYLLAPYRLATSLDVPLGLAASSIRVLASHAATGAAIAVTAMSLAWALRGRHSLVVAGWLVLGCVAMVDRLLLPAFVAEAPVPERDAQMRTFDRLLHQVELVEAPREADSLPAAMRVLDPAMLRTWGAARMGRMYFATPAMDGEEPGWWMAWKPDVHEAAAEVVRVADGQATALGQPLLQQSVGSFPAGFAVAPGLTGWAPSPTGIRAGGWFRRAALAWALQAPSILRLSADDSLDWLRDPADRAHALMPGLTWVTEGLVPRDGRWFWIVAGLATVDRAPLSTRVAHAGRTVSGVVTALIASVAADDGTVTVVRDPARHPLGEAWAAIHPTLAVGADSGPAREDGRVYPQALLATQLDVLAQPHWQLGARPQAVVNDSILPVPPVHAGAPGAWQAMFEDPSHGRSVALVEARRRDGAPVLAVHRLPDPTMPALRELTAAWLRMPTPAQLADSLRAAGDSLLAGPIRWHIGAGGPVAWQGFRSTGTAGAVSLLWVGTAWPAGIGGARRPETAWQGRGRADSAGSAPGPRVDALGQLEAIRTWMARADSALARGDLTAFGRAWEALRGLLLSAPPRGPEAAP
jgi:hypothetical protein